MPRGVEYRKGMGESVLVAQAKKIEKLEAQLAEIAEVVAGWHGRANSLMFDEFADPCTEIRICANEIQAILNREKSDE